MIIHPEPQGTPEWHARRLGMLTASNMSALITPAGKPSKSQTALTLVDRLLGEIYTGEPDADIGHLPAIARGHELEPRGREYYAAMYDADIRECGLAVSDCGLVGASFDGLIFDGDDLVATWEMKAPARHTHVHYMRGGTDVPAYRAQVQTQLYVSGLPRVEFLSYYPRLPEVRVVIEPDPDWQSLIAELVEEFAARMAAGREEMEALGCQDTGISEEWVAAWRAEQEAKLMMGGDL